MKQIRTYLFVATTAFLLAGCTAKCNCPDCPRTTVVTPGY